MVSASSFALTLSSSLKRSASERVLDRIESASTRACSMIFADSCCMRASSSFARSAPSSDFLIASCRPSSDFRSGRHANFARSPSRTRKVRIVQINSPGSGWTSGLFITNYLLFRLLQRRQGSWSQYHNEKNENLGQDGDAFKQKQRQVHRAGDPVGGCGLSRDAVASGGR